MLRWVMVVVAAAMIPLWWVSAPKPKLPRAPQPIEQALGVVVEEVQVVVAAAVVAEVVVIVLAAKLMTPVAADCCSSLAMLPRTTARGGRTF